MAEIEFDQPENEQPQEPEAQEEAQPEPEIEPQAQEEEPDRLGRLEHAVSELVEWARSSQPTQQAPSTPAPTRKRPDFGDNPVANVLYDEIQAIRDEVRAPWEKLEQQRAENDAVNAAFASLQDDSARYIQNRVADGDPKVKPEELATMLISMGQLRDKRVPIAKALQNAYNAVAFDSMKESVRNKTFNEARKPGARIPAPYQPQMGQRRPQMQQNDAAKPGESRMARLKREMEASDNAIGRMTPEQLEDSMGGNLT